MNIAKFRSRKVVVRVASVVATTLSLGCADVSVRKVPTPTQYTHWSDDMQARADAIQGIRFYLPRPFISVFESFPVRTDIYWANGSVSSDGKYVTITSITALDEAPTAVNIQVPSTGVSFNAKNSLNAQGQVDSPAKTDSVSIPVTASPAAAASPATPLPPNAPALKTGQNQQKSTNNNGAFAYQPLRGNFDLVYMPDFEEQYAVDSHAGLGNANFEVNLGQGWSLQGYNSLTDNSEINKRIFDVIDTAAQAAKTVANVELGQLFPSAMAAAKSAKPDNNLTTNGDVEAPASQKGTSVTMKVVVLHYAAKGLYPVIKPRELQERVVAEPQTTYGVLDLFKLFPRVEWSSTFDRNSLARSQQALGPEAAHFTVPRYPYQYISFNTFQYVAIQVLGPEDQPFKTKYPGTGTDNESGAARVGELTDLIKQLQQIQQAKQPTDGGGVAVEPGTPSPEAKKALVGQTNALHLPNSTGNNYSLAALDLDKLPAVAAALKINGGHPPDMTESQARKEFQSRLIAFAKEQSINVNAITLTNRPDLTKLQAFYDEIRDSKKVGFPKPDPATPAPQYSIDDAWLETDPLHPLTGTLFVKIKKDAAAPATTAAVLQDSLPAQLQPILDKQFTPSIKITVNVVNPGSL